MGPTWIPQLPYGTYMGPILDIPYGLARLEPMWVPYGLASWEAQEDKHKCKSHNKSHLTLIELTMWLAGNRLLQRLMSPSQKSQVMFASAFSGIGEFVFVFLVFVVFTLLPLC